MLNMDYRLDMDRDKLRKGLSKQYQGDGLGFLVAEAKALIMSGDVMSLTDDHFEAVLIDFSVRKRALNLNMESF